VAGIEWWAASIPGMGANAFVQAKSGLPIPRMRSNLNIQGCFKMSVHRVKSPKVANERRKYSMNQLNYTTLIAKLADMPGPRSKCGRRYEWLLS
jgi:hypothetical protein